VLIESKAAGPGNGHETVGTGGSDAGTVPPTALGDEGAIAAVGDAVGNGKPATK
jgi:hypothetical protein